VSVKTLQDGKPGCSLKDLYFNRKPVGAAGSTLTNVTNLPAIPPGGSHDDSMAIEARDP